MKRYYTYQQQTAATLTPWGIYTASEQDRQPHSFPITNSLRKKDINQVIGTEDWNGQIGADGQPVWGTLLTPAFFILLIPDCQRYTLPVSLTLL